MSRSLAEMFEDPVLAERIRDKLPHLFNIAEIESSRGGKIGMEVGSARERILIALLIYKFGEDNVDTEIGITSREVDVELFGSPISIKTITGSGRVKVSWTVDAQKAREFARDYLPGSEILLAQIKWDMKQEDMNKGIHPGGLFLIPVEVQREVLQEIGKDNYLSLPKPGTNPRGVEISGKVLTRLLEHPNTKCVPIVWKHSHIEYDPYKRWVDYWKE